MSLRDDIARLKDLDAKATRGEWQYLPREKEEPYLRIRGTRLGYRYKIANVHGVEYENPLQQDVDESKANAALIAAARNTLPRLITQVERMEMALKELLESEEAIFPPATAGIDEQNAWAERKLTARWIAREALKGMEE